jgi:thiamine-phosphate pyrophosphorylase
MKIIAITSPKVTDADEYIIKGLVNRGIDVVHFRKPDSGIEECRSLLLKLTSGERSKIVVHDYPSLYEEFSLLGIHVNKNVTSLPEGYSGLKTRSCHSFEEVEMYKDDYDYLFLSPIFNSISKQGYMSSFSDAELLQASREGVIDRKVIALGGVTFDKIPYLKDLNFGGVAMIGAIYNTDVLERLDDFRQWR